jgi:hypothetical protein
VAIAEWNPLCEAARFRRWFFAEDQIAAELREIADRDEVNVVFGPRTAGRYYEYAPRGGGVCAGQGVSWLLSRRACAASRPSGCAARTALCGPVGLWCPLPRLGRRSEPRITIVAAANSSSPLAMPIAENIGQNRPPRDC